MKGREGKAAAPTDLLVCFPSRGHLSLMPKQISSPVRSIESGKRHNHHLPHHLSRSTNNINRGGGQGSPQLWGKTKSNYIVRGGGGGSSEFDEPTSPKVTCAGQIKVKTKSGTSCKNWQSVMEEIERIHKKNKSSPSSSSKHKKKSTWGEALGFKKDVVQFLTCLRGFRFDLRCFGNFPRADVLTSDDDGEEEEEDDDDDEDEDGEEERELRDEFVHHADDNDDGSSSKTVFSKWFMVLQEEGIKDKDDEDEVNYSSVAPPPNALLLMRCRSAPAKSRLEIKQEEEEKQKEREGEEEEDLEESKNKLKLLLEKEKKKKEESNMIVRCYSPDFFKVSSDVAKETWVVGGVNDSLSRSRSWKR